MVSLVAKYTTKCPFLQVFARNIVNTPEPAREIQFNDSTESNFMKKCPFAKYLTENPTLFQQTKPQLQQETPQPKTQKQLIVQKDNYNDIFTGVLDKIKGEGRYREFIQIQRQTGQFPEAIFHSSNYFTNSINFISIF